MLELWVIQRLIVHKKAYDRYYSKLIDVSNLQINENIYYSHGNYFGIVQSPIVKNRYKSTFRDDDWVLIWNIPIFAEYIISHVPHFKQVNEYDRGLSRLIKVQIGVTFIHINYLHRLDNLWNTSNPQRTSSNIIIRIPSWYENFTRTHRRPFVRGMRANTKAGGNNDQLSNRVCCFCW